MKIDWTNFCTSLCQVLKLVLFELIIYVVLYCAINLIYRLVEDEAAEDFTRVVEYLQSNLRTMARFLTFLLGFYVATMAKRWWELMRLLPVPDNLAILLTSVVIADDTYRLKEKIMNCSMASWIICLRRFSPEVKKKFADWMAFKEFGLMNDEQIASVQTQEISIQHHSNEENPDRYTWMIPLNWAADLVKRAKKDNLIGNDAKEIWREIIRFRNQLQDIEDIYLNPLPFIYKTVVVTAVYSFLALSIVAEQDIGMTHIQLYFPLFGILNVIWFVGWLKAALVMENPLKKNFQLESLLSRHITIFSVLIHQGDNNFISGYEPQQRPFNNI